jgi:hypothetical protein
VRLISCRYWVLHSVPTTLLLPKPVIWDYSIPARHLDQHPYHLTGNIDSTFSARHRNVVRIDIICNHTLRVRPVVRNHADRKGVARGIEGGPDGDIALGVAVCSGDGVGVALEAGRVGVEVGVHVVVVDVVAGETAAEYVDWVGLAGARAAVGV